MAVPRTKIMKLAVAPGCTARGVCPAAIGAEPKSTASAAQIEWRRDMASAYQAAREQAAFMDRSSRGRLLVNGRDRATYLQGLLTNDTVALKTGDGCYAAYLTPQGRMISDLWVYELGDVILLSLPGDVKDTVLAKLDQFIFSEDVQLGDVTGTFGQVAVVGPRAAEVVGSLLDDTPAVRLGALHENGNVRGSFAGAAAIVTRIDDLGEPGFDIYVERGGFDGFKRRLLDAGAVELDPQTAEVLRVEAGVPEFHHDMDEETIPLEAGIEARAISQTKGCYVGQEVIIRVLHRGHGRVARKLVGLTLDGDAVPERGAVVKSDQKNVGEVTSSVRSIALGRPISLAYLQRDFVAPGTVVSVDGASAVVTALPFAS
jgi:tRNA-modifying protein YgfZ